MVMKFGLDFPLWMRILRYLNRYDSVIESRVSKDLDSTYGHCVSVLNFLYSEGYISFVSKGRSKFVSLTPKGREQAIDIDKIMSRKNISVIVQRGV